MDAYFTIVSLVIACISTVSGYGPIPSSGGTKGGGIQRTPPIVNVVPENNVLSFAPYPVASSSQTPPGIRLDVRPNLVPVQEDNKVDQYWWLKQDTPFSLTPVAAGGQPEHPLIQAPSVIAPGYQSSPSTDEPPKQSCVDYNCIAKARICTKGFACVPKIHCLNDVVSKSTVDALSVSSGRNEYCSDVSGTCCKVIVTETQGYVPSVIESSGSIGTPVLVPSGSSYNVPVQPPTPSINPEPSQVPYTGLLNTTPYPGCAAALKCVPDQYCNVDGIMTAAPVALTKDLLQSRVPLSECLDPVTGISGKCCRDPNYKDPWPDHDHSHEHDHSHDHSHEHDHNHSDDKFDTAQGQVVVVTDSPVKDFTIKKPIGGFTSKPSSFATKLHHDNAVPNDGDVLYNVVPDSATNYELSTNRVLVSNAVEPKPIPQYPITYGQAPQPSITYGQVPQPLPAFFSSGNFDTGNQIPNFDLQTKLNNPAIVVNIPSSPQPSQTPFFQFETSSQYVPQQQPIDITHRVIPNVPISLIPSNVQSSTTRVPTSTIVLTSTQSPVIASDSFSDCGKYNIYDNEGEVPWQSTIISANNKTVLCDGVIISENAILTSAHCLDYVSSDDVEVVIGSKLSRNYIIRAAVISRHAQYDTQSYKKDMAVILLRQPIIFDQYVQKICLSPLYEQNFYSDECFVSSSTALPDGSKNIKVQLFPYKDCENRLKNSYLGKYFVLGDGFTCASALTDSSLCQAKIGSPIICHRGDGTYDVYGTKSWDLGCQDYKKFSIFSKSDSAWILKTLNEPLDQLIVAEQLYLKKQFKGETLEQVNVEHKPGFALGYGK